MPQVSGNFSAYPVKVTLDANGNGAIRFQAVGSNVRVSNLSVRVSTQTAQAVATVYKNLIGSDYRLSGTNSGSSGDSLSIPTDLFDGEALIVEWVGGDPGAEATATFSGKQLPFEEVGKGEGGANWTSPIAAGDGSLIYPSIKSPNYVTALVGWFIGRDGTVEFASGTFRGEVNIVGSGRTVRVYSGGVMVFPTPSDGSALLMTTAPAFGGALRFSPITPTSPGITLGQADWFVGRTDNGAGTVRPFARINSPFINGAPPKDVGRINLYGEASDTGYDDSYIELIVDQIRTNGISSGRGWQTGQGANANSAAIGNSETSLIQLPSFFFKRGHAYRIQVDMQMTTSVASRGPLFRIRQNYVNAGSPGTEIISARKTSDGIAAGIQSDGSFGGVFIVGTGADVTTALTLTGTSGSGTFTFTMLGSPPPEVNIFDIGSSTDHPFARAIV